MSELLQDQFVKVGGVNTCYWSLGSEGTPILLLHGLGACKENWRYNVPSLARSHQVYAIDLVGFGLSDKPSATYSLGYFTQFVCDWMDKVGVARASLVGHSLGGAVALSCALQHPDRIDKLVLVDSAALGRALHAGLRLMTLPILGELLNRPGRPGARRVLVTCFFNPGLISEEDVETKYERSLLPGAVAALLSTSRAVFNWGGTRESVVRSILDNLQQITAPTLVIWGKEDRVIPVSLAQVAKERMPNAQVLLFEQCGHAPQTECADQFNAAVLEFLAQ